MSVISRFPVLAAAATAAVFMAGSAFASTISLDYDRLPLSSSNQGVADQLVTLVSDNTTSALFRFEVTTGDEADLAIRQIYFEDSRGLFSGISIFAFSDGVDFETGNANPKDLSSGETAEPAFNATPGLNAQAKQGAGGAAQIDLGEYLTLSLTYADAFGFADVRAALDDGNLRVGLRATDPVSSYVSRATGTPVAPIPLPAAGWLLVTALGGLGAAGLRRRRKDA